MRSPWGRNPIRICLKGVLSLLFLPTFRFLSEQDPSGAQ